jgi:hypothetical protein
MLSLRLRIKPNTLFTMSSVFSLALHHPQRPVVDPSQPQTVLSPELRPKSPLPRSRPSTPSAATSTALNPFEVRVRLPELRQPGFESTVDEWNDVLDRLVTLR